MNDQQKVLESCHRLDLAGKIGEAIVLLTASIDSIPTAVTYYERGSRFEEIGQYDFAKNDYTQAIRLESLSKYWIARGSLLSNHLSDHEAGLHDFKEALKVAPQDPNVYIHLTLCNILLGKLSDAIENARVALEFAPNNASAHFGLGQCLLAANRPSDAAEELRIATTLDPTSANYWGIRSRALRKSEKLSEARACIQRAIELDRSAGYLISYASLLLDLNEPLHAITVLQEVQRMDLTEGQGLLVDGYLGRGNRMLREKGTT